MSAGSSEGFGAGSAGARLAKAREAAGLSIADVAAQTRIPVRHLAAIEAGDLNSLPGRSYAIGFAKTYARAVGEDEAAIGSAIAAEYSASTPVSEAASAPAFAPGDPARVPSSRFVWAAAAAFAVVGAGGYVWWDKVKGAGEAPPLVVETPVVPAAEASAAPTAAASVASLEQGAVVLTAQVDALWVKIYDGAGKQLLQKQLALGESYTVPADAVEPKIWTGRPDALAITVGGHAVPKIADAQKTVKDVPISAKALLARTVPAPTPAPVAAPAAVAGSTPVVALPKGAVPHAAPQGVVATPVVRRARVHVQRTAGAAGEAATAQRALNAGGEGAAAPSAAPANPSTAPQ